MYIILNLDDFRFITILMDEEGATLLFTDPDEAQVYAEASLAVYQVVELDENA